MPLSLWYLYQYKASIDMYMPHALKRGLGAGINIESDENHVTFTLVCESVQGIHSRILARIKKLGAQNCQL